MRSLFLFLLLIFSLNGIASKGKKYAVGKIDTNKGEILFLLHDKTPNHKASFIKLANETHFWDSLTFNRVINNFVAQGGCPDTPEGFANSPYLLQPEFRKELRHVYGAVGAGRDDNKEMLSAGCQFYIVQNKEGLARLDDKFTVYGQVFKGMDVVDAIVAVKTDKKDEPLEPITLKIRVIYLSAKKLKKMGYDKPLS